MNFKSLLVNGFEYHEFVEVDRNHIPKYKKPIAVKNCRIDLTAEYSRSKTESDKRYKAIVFCYKRYTRPFLPFKEQSKVTVNGEEFVIGKVVPVTGITNAELYSYELELV